MIHDYFLVYCYSQKENMYDTGTNFQFLAGKQVLPSQGPRYPLQRPPKLEPSLRLFIPQDQRF